MPVENQDQFYKCVLTTVRLVGAELERLNILMFKRTKNETQQKQKSLAALAREQHRKDGSLSSSASESDSGDSSSESSVLFKSADEQSSLDQRSALFESVPSETETVLFASAAGAVDFPVNGMLAWS